MRKLKVGDWVFLKKYKDYENTITHMEYLYTPSMRGLANSGKKLKVAATREGGKVLLNWPDVGSFCFHISDIQVESPELENK